MAPPLLPNALLLKAWPLTPIAIWQLALLAGLSLFCILAPERSNRLGRRLLALWRLIARRPARAVLLVGAIAFVGSAAVSWQRPPVPSIADEFGYLLQGDTFAHLRLTNPTHPMWRYFESYF